jgi:acid phosphatase
MANYILQGSVADKAGNVTTAPVTVTVNLVTGNMPTFGHVFIVVEENSNYSSIVGNSSMPYLNSLMAKYGLATQYYAVTHPSIGNYFSLTCGQILTNDDSSSTIENVPNIVRSLVAAGKTWKSYAESIPSVGYLGGDTGEYARKHNVIALYSDVANDPNGQAKNLVPFTQFPIDLAAGTLPNYSMIVPNLQDDLHDGTAAQADQWLQTNIDPLIQSTLFKNDGLLFIVFDESSNDNTNGGGRVVCVVISAKTIPGYQSTTLYQHPSVLRTMMEALGFTTFPGAAATAPDMVEFFTGITPPPPAVASVVISPSSVTVTTGQTTQLTAVAKDSSGNTISGQTFVWASSNSAVATVNNTGLVSALTLGSVTITATTNGIIGSALITTVAPIIVGNATWTVDVNAGSDSNSGSSTAPFKTLQKAAGVVNPGDLVLVNDGIYQDGDTVLNLSRSGTNSGSGLITFKATNRWKAIIDGNNNSSSQGVNFGGAFNRIDGFEIRNIWHDGVEASHGNDNQIAHCHIHDIGRQCSSGSEGRSAIDAYSDGLLVEGCLIHDIGRFAPGENGCSPTTDYYQNHDHGIYWGQGLNVIIRNNIFYNCFRGWAIQRYGGSATPTGYIINNTFAFPNPYRTGHIIVAGSLTDVVIANNLFYQPTQAGIYWDGGTMTNVIVENNLSTNAIGTSSSVSGVNFANNLPNTDPKLVNTATFDFHLQSISPAIGNGITLAQVLDNFDGLSRVGAPYNIGAY